jgi:hypothetical protein
MAAARVEQVLPANPSQRQIAEDALRAGRTQVEADRAALVAYTFDARTAMGIA